MKRTMALALMGVAMMGASLGCKPDCTDCPPPPPPPPPPLPVAFHGVWDAHAVFKNCEGETIADSTFVISICPDTPAFEDLPADARCSDILVSDRSVSGTCEYTLDVAGCTVEVLDRVEMHLDASDQLVATSHEEMAFPEDCPLPGVTCFDYVLTATRIGPPPAVCPDPDSVAIVLE